MNGHERESSNIFILKASGKEARERGLRHGKKKEGDGLGNDGGSTLRR
jgi:hypothetical protein